MNRNKPLKKAIACLLVLVLVVGGVFVTPQTASASGATPPGSQDNWLKPPTQFNSAAAALTPWSGNVDVSWYDPTSTEFHISTPEQLAGVAAIVNGLMNPGTFVTGNPEYIVDMVPGANSGHYGADDFSGKTIYIDNDLNMGGVYDFETKEWKSTSPNFMPIGGSYCIDITNTRSNLSSSFDGVLDGQGHMLYNIACLRNPAVGSWPLNEAYGVIGRLGNNSHLPPPQGGNNLVSGVKRLGITGYMQGYRMVGGIVGATGRTTNGYVIEQCANYATVFQTDAFGAGGIVGQASGDGLIRNCFNAGYILRRASWFAGGIVGISSVEMRNCYNYGKVDSMDGGGASSIAFGAAGSTDFNNCYWLTQAIPSKPENTLGGIGGYLSGNPTVRNSSALSYTYMTNRTDDSFINSLNTIGAVGAADSVKQGNVFVKDEWSLNKGYPLLYWQAPGGILEYEITVDAPEHGTLQVSPLPDEQSNLPFGTYLTLTATPEDGYSFASYLVDGVAQTSNKVYIDGAKTVSAKFFLRESIGSYHFARISTMSQTGSALTPQPFIYNGAETAILSLGNDYTLSYANNTNTGTATITAKGIGNYQGTIEGHFAITSKTVLQSAIANAQDVRSQILISEIDGQDVEPDEFWVSADDEQNFYGAFNAAQEVKAYGESSQEEIDAAKETLEAAVAILGAAKKPGVMIPNPSLEPLQTAKANAESAYADTDVSLDGRAIAQTRWWVSQVSYKTDLQIALYNASLILNALAPTTNQVKDATDALNLALETFYALRKAGLQASSEAVNPGNKSDVTQENKATAPAKTSIKKLTVGKKKLTIIWKKLAAAQMATKYQIRYRIKGSSAWKTKIVAANKSSLAISKLKRGKKYQVQVRACKTVQSKNYYSAWSATKVSKAIK